MTTIGQDVNNFTDGSEFSSIDWSDGMLCCGNNEGYPWSGGGFQCYPNDNTKIIVTNQNGEVAKDDTIDLHAGNRGSVRHRVLKLAQCSS
jgi:hypothetical protein